MKIDINKKYRYRGGAAARVICVDAPSEFPVIAIDDCGEASTHTAEGRLLIGGESVHDLVEVREPREWELILHTDGKGVSIFCDQGGNPKGGEIVRVREIIA